MHAHSRRRTATRFLRAALVPGALVATALASPLATPLAAQDALRQIEIHGYGGWGFGRLQSNDSPNFFAFAHRRGDYSHSEFALNVSLPVNDRVTVMAQPFWHSGHHANQTESGIDYAFGEYKQSDLVRLRAGLVKQPFGLYTEIFDVGTLRPFSTLPQSVYGGTGFAGKAYGGLGLTGSLFATRDWSLVYDAYGGGLEVTDRDGALQVAAEGADTTGRKLSLTVTKTFRNVVGGRVMLGTPVDGLQLGVSGYTATRPVGLTEPRRRVGAVSAEYVTESWSLRSEVSRQTESDLMQRAVTAGYAEAAYSITRAVQVAGLYSTLDTKLRGATAANLAHAPSLLEHEEWGAGLNYWLSDTFVIKTSYHWVDGNRLASPDQADIRSAVARGVLPRKTRAVFVSSSLSF
jgi:hypothetical protein